MRRNLKQKILCFMLCFVLAFGCIESACFVQPVEAASVKTQKKKALKAYKKFLKQSTISWGYETNPNNEFGFYVKDMNGDKIPELFVTCYTTSAASGYERMYTYKNGKVVELLEANHAGFYIYPSKQIVVVDGAGTGGAFTYVCKLGKKKMTLMAEAYGKWVNKNDDIDLDYTYRIKTAKTLSSTDDLYTSTGGTVVSKAKFTKYVKKLTGTKNFTSSKKTVPYKKNTAKNRKKYLS
ncbi:MAG: hypothetical protein LUF92_11095 [Clostridiales bacterium]|nr:hypothetical protein [Clostridiales bacterium]